jgi:hypothetical protein
MTFLFFEIYSIGKKILNVTSYSRSKNFYFSKMFNWKTERKFLWSIVINIDASWSYSYHYTVPFWAVCTQPPQRTWTVTAFFLLGPFPDQQLRFFFFTFWVPYFSMDRPSRSPIQLLARGGLYNENAQLRTDNKREFFGGIFINTSLELTRLLITSTFTKRNNIFRSSGWIGPS